ncbi:hypothetical protein CC2G_006133 [Coprinopsis cinerea AmutBmut pab1-1]|nr:hypothetical protein CC2G_006133 [Coprinopsis cinerea AmutBmut pab1-1]
MPPKRKRVEDGASAEATTSTRSTRSSTRNKTAAAEPAPAPAKQTKKTKAAAALESGTTVTEEEPATKRKRTTKAATNGGEKPATKRGRKKAEASEDEPSVVVSPNFHKVDSIQSRPSHHSLSTNVSQQQTVQPQTPKKTAPPPPKPAKTASDKPEPYSPQRSLELFAQYADSDAPDVIGPEGFEQLFTDAEIPMDGALPLIFAWQMNAAEMAKISKEEWVKGTESLKISSLKALSIALNDLQNLLISKLPPLKKPTKSDQEPYDRTNYYSYAHNSESSFQKFYSYCFVLAKPQGSRNIDMETSTAFWSVLLMPRYPIMQEVVEFINSKKDTYRATNKDLWSMMLEFCQTVKPTLEDYETDGAWPTLLDDFVLWKKTDGGAQPNGTG